MSDAKPPSKSPEELQKEIQDFLKDRLGTDVFAIPLGVRPGAPDTSAAAPDERAQEAAPPRGTPDAISEFQMTPSEVKAYLDRFVIGQDEAKRALSVAVCDHYNHVRLYYDRKDSVGGHEPPADPGTDYVKQNICLLGPTGVGKTYLIRILAHLIGVPFVKADITKFSETGYVGGDVDDLVRELVRLADGDEELASHGMIFLDEIDKITSAPTAMGRDPSGRGVQIGLLKLMEDTEVPLRSPMDIGAQFQDFMQMRRGGAGKKTINTRHILFVVSGAFSGLPEIVEKRLSERNVGFAAASMETKLSDGAPDEHLLRQVNTRDLVEYGFEPEFVGRLPIRVALNDLSEDDLFDILCSSEGSILHQYRESFRGYGIDVAFEPDALRDVARRAHEERTGARGLMTVLESVLRDFKFHLAGTDVSRFAVTRRLLEDSAAALDEIRGDPARAAEQYVLAAVREFEAEFADRHGVRLLLDEAAAQMAAGVASQVATSLKAYLRATFEPHVAFLLKVSRESGRSELKVTPQILSRPGAGVELWMGNAGGRA